MRRSLKIAAPSTELVCLILIATSVLLLSKEGSAVIKPECQCYLFQSNGRSSGYFKSPYFPRPYPSNLNCVLYTFVGDLDEIVELNFFEFTMRPGRRTNGNCTDKVRLYLNMHRPEINEKDKWDYEICGKSQHLRQTSYYSRDRVSIMYLHTDRLRGVNYQYNGFKGMYTFLRKEQFITDGHQVELRHKKCVYYFNSTIRKKGRFFSPRYPQNYRNGISCDYQFQGKPKERILINFNNIKLHGDINRCDPATAGDRISAYDGLTTHSSKLAHYCGLHNGPQVVSHGNALLVHFQSDRDGITSQGFAADYTFVLKYSVQPTKIIQEPMRGDQTSKAGPEYPVSESHEPCEEIYESSLQTKSGVFTLPRSPYELGLTCTFKIKGQRDETVTLNFENIQLDKADHLKCLSHNGDKIEVYNGMSDAQSFLAVLCGQQKYTQQIHSTGPHVTVKFIADNKRHEGERGFRATFKFKKRLPIIDETVTVTESGDLPQSNCKRRIYSKTDPNSPKEGEVSTPGYPNGYRPGILCNWVFIGLKGERVQLEFTEISLNKPSRQYDRREPEYGPIDDRCKDQDRLEIYKFHTNAALATEEKEETMSYCNNASPPIAIMSTDKSQLEMKFISTPDSVGNGKGLFVRYAFLTNFSVKAPFAQQVFKERCVFRFVSWSYPNGTFTSPNYPGHYPEMVTCEYVFQGREDETVYIVFDDFDLDSNDEKCDPRLDDFLVPQYCDRDITTRIQEPHKRICYPNQHRHEIRWNNKCLRLKFYSNKYTTKRGFHAHYYFVRKAQSRQWQDPKKDAAKLSAAMVAPLSLLVTLCTLFLSSVFTRACV